VEYSRECTPLKTTPHGSPYGSMPYGFSALRTG
jgi:hypothetical protein